MDTAEISLTETVPLERLKDKPVRDYSSLWNLPADANKIGFRISSRTDESNFTAESGLTEGRITRLPRFVFEFKGVKQKDISNLPELILHNYLFKNKELRPVNMSYLITKGGGYKPGMSPEVKPVDGKVPRYFKGEVLGRNYGAIPAGSLEDSEQKLDEVFSLAYHAWGGRTRLPISTYPTDEFSSPHGIINLEKAKSLGYFKDPDAKAVIANWGIRIPWTIDDLVGTIDDPRLMSTRDSMDKTVMMESIHPSVDVFGKPEKPTTEAVESALSIARDIVNSAKYDDEQLWIELANKYKELSPENLEEFYKNYLPVLFKTIGQQIGIQYQHNVYLYMLNFSNVTALGEFKDFDVAVFNAKHFIDGTELSKKEMVKTGMIANESEEPNEPELQARNFFNSVKYLTSVFLSFRNSGIINCDSEEFAELYKESMNGFTSGFVEKGIKTSLNPKVIKRNIEMITALEKEYANNPLWATEPNILADEMRDKNKTIYSIVIRKSENDRGVLRN